MQGRIILIGGLPGAGKSTITKKVMISTNGIRHNRDIFGGSRDAYNKALEDIMIKNPGRTIILDNTYINKDMRTGPLALAKKHDWVISCYWMLTSKEDAIFNACKRQVETYGKLLSPEELKATKSPNMFNVDVIYRFNKMMEVPTTEEGFDEIINIPFVRESWPADYNNKAIIFDYDGTLRTSKAGNKAPNKPEDVEILPGRTQYLRTFQKMGYYLLGVSNQAGIARGHLTKQDAIDCFDQTHKLLGITLDYRFCEHNSIPVQCFCRKPNVGFAIEFIIKYKLDPSKCIFVGDMTSDKTFASRAGFQFALAENFFSNGYSNGSAELHEASATKKNNKAGKLDKTTKPRKAKVAKNGSGRSRNAKTS